jgi:hypothetical protein
MVKPVSIDELLQRVGSQPDGNVWLAIVVAPSDSNEIVEDLKETINIFTECEVGVISGEGGTLDLIRKVEQTTEDYLLVWGFKSWNRDNWREFDYARSRLTRKRGGVLLLSSESVKALFTHSPNFASWLGSRVYRFDKDREFLTTDERQARLSLLREWSGLSDSEVIELAQARKLPPAPEYGEWLVLLNREDLIER